MKRAGLAMVAVLAAALAACSGVPTTSAPQAVEALDTGDGNTQVSVAPREGDARQIVGYFLDENGATGVAHPAARAYLTTAANNRWSEDTATIIANEPTISTFDEQDNDSATVTVLGRVLGTLNARTGIYTPSLQGDGQGGDRQRFVFHLVKLDNGLWRIDRPPQGLLLSDEQFRDTYRQQVLYFYDLNEDRLVPDLRWSAQDDRVQLAQWLLTLLVDGPRPDLAGAVSPDTMPAHIDPTRISVQLGTPTLIEIPGSSQLDAEVRDRLAAQISQTLIEVLSGREMSITDNQVPVQIPSVVGTVFDASDFTTSVGPPVPTSKVFYLTGGKVRDDSGSPVAGPLGDGSYFLSAVAIGQPKPDAPELAAGLIGSGSTAQLYVGSVRDGLNATRIRGALSRPAFAPGRAEVWVGAGSRLYRVDLAGAKPRVYPVQIVTGGGRILALRISPDGSRIAMAIASATGKGQLYVGSVVRGAGQVRVDGLQQPISPVGVVVTDVAWLDPVKLFAIGYLVGSQDTRSFETGVDGTDWTNSTVNLPDPPDSVTAATSSNVWVSANGYVWELSGTTWTSPGGTGQTAGTQPVYLD
jgi:hypothetical protein